MISGNLSDEGRTSRRVALRAIEPGAVRALVGRGYESKDEWQAHLD